MLDKGFAGAVISPKRGIGWDTIDLLDNRIVNRETKRTGDNIIAGMNFNFSLTQDNFLGTGNRYSIAVNTSDSDTLYRLAFTDPYWTLDGISRTYRFNWRERDLSEENLSDYTTDNFSFGAGFTIPINEFDRIGLGLDYEDTRIKIPNGGCLPTGLTAQNICDFVAEEGDKYKSLRFQASWSHDTRNKHIFPDRGAFQRLSGDFAVPGSDIRFYHLNYLQQRFFPGGR